MSQVFVFQKFIFCQNSTSLFSSNYLSFGSNFGLNPNYRNPKPEGYWFVEGGANVNIKKLPFILSFRQSNELLFTGRSSYFKFSLNPQQQSFNRLDLISKKLDLVKSEIDALNLNLSTTKSDISYLNTLLNNQKLKNLDHSVKLKSKLSYAACFNFSNSFTVKYPSAECRLLRL